MRKFLPFSKRQPSLDRYSVHRGGWGGNERLSVKSIRRTSAASLSIKSIQVVRGAYNIDLNKVDSSFTKLHKACLLNDESQVRKHVQKVDSNVCDSSRRYPIHLASVNGNFTIIKLLIENGADPNVQDNEGDTPLIKSIESGHEHLVKYLLANGADPNLADREGNAALHWAIVTESVIAVDALICSKKCDLLASNNRGETCLHLAVRSPLITTPIIESLIEAGSDLTMRDQLGLTAIDIAQACNNEVAMNAFRLRGHIVDDRDNEGLETVNSTKSDILQSDENACTTKLCEEYKIKFLKKNKENLQYEKQCIQLAAEIERLKLDLGYLKEHNETLERDLEQLSTENITLKSENSDLRRKLKKTKEKLPKRVPNNNVANGAPRDDASNPTHEVGNDDCRGHEEFHEIKITLQERIDKLKSGLTT